MINALGRYAENAPGDPSNPREYGGYEEQYDGKADPAVDVIWDVARHEQDDEEPREACEGPDHRARDGRL